MKAARRFLHLRDPLILFLGTLAVVASVAGEQRTVTRLDASRISPAEIDSTVTQLMKAAEVPGLGLAILNDGKIVYLKGYGLRDKEKGLPMTVDTAMYAASFTKVAFGYMVMQLVDQGVLDPDKPVYEYLPKALPEYPNYADLASDDRYKKITARMLLDHTSGFPNWRAFEDDRKLKIHFEPGSRFAYSGEGLALLQLVVETITKKPLEELMRQLVFQPLGMKRTSMVWQARFDHDYANGYDEYGQSLGPDKRKNADAAGSMTTTVSDFAHFVEAVMQGKNLRPKTYAEILSPQIRITSKHEFPPFENVDTHDNDAIRLSYGLTWGLYWSPYGEALFKEGHADGWRNYTVSFAKPKAGIVIMTNSGTGEGIYNDLLETLLKDTFTPIEWEGFTPYNRLPPRPPLPVHKAVVVDPQILQKYVGRYGNPPDLVLAVRRSGDHLSIQENDEPVQELLAENDTTFFSTTADDVFTFESDAAGRVIKMVLHTGGKDIPLSRIQ